MRELRVRVNSTPTECVGAGQRRSGLHAFTPSSALDAVAGRARMSSSADGDPRDLRVVEGVGDGIHERPGVRE